MARFCSVPGCYERPTDDGFCVYGPDHPPMRPPPKPRRDESPPASPVVEGGRAASVAPTAGVRRPAGRRGPTAGDAPSRPVPGPNVHAWAMRIDERYRRRPEREVIGPCPAYEELRRLLGRDR